MMPGLTGIDVLKAIRRRFSNLELPVIMATAKDQTEDMVVALGAGANDYVVKPIDFPVLLARIQSHLRSKAEMRPAEQKLRPGDLRPGLVLAEKYRIEQEIGAGNFGIVFKATHLDLQQPVALKILSAAIDEKDSADLERLRLEGASAFRLQHPNAVHVLDFAFAHGLAFLVMELLDGTSLEVFLAQEKRLSPRRAVEIVAPICEVLAQAHQLGIIHRDIKPANIFLHKTPRGEVVKVLDFGIAKFVGDSAMNKNLTLDEGILGTPIYIAPERLSSQDYDGRADVYSVGIMLYQMVAGTLPFPFHKKEPLAIAVQHLTAQPERLQTHLPEVSIAFESVVMSTLKKQPQERPSASELVARLRQAIDPGKAAYQRQDSSEETTGIIQMRRERAAAAATPASAAPAAKNNVAAAELEAGATRILSGSITARLTFDFADLLEPAAKPPSAAPLPVRPPRDGVGPWS